MSIDKTTLYLYGAVLAGILTVTTFAYSMVLVPAWSWVSTLPSTAKGYFSSKTTPSNSSANNYQTGVARTAAPLIVSPEKTPKPVNCGKIIKQIKTGRSVGLPPECEQTYQAFKDQEQAKLEAEKQKEEFRQRDLEREKQERENQQKLEFERQKEAGRQQEQERRRQEAEQLRAAQQEREQLRQEAENRRRQEAKDEGERMRAQRTAEQRERERQRQAQKRTDAIIKFGNDIGRKILKRNR
jgi:septal ring factor EnvC (AmiA/AmiB activator)